MKRTALTKQAPHPWPFSHGIVVEGPARLVFLAGQVAFDRQGPARQLVGVGDPAAQTRQAIENVRTLLRQAGGDLRDVVEMMVYANQRGSHGARGLHRPGVLHRPAAGAVVHRGEGARASGAPRRDPGDRGHTSAGFPGARTNAADRRATAARATDLTARP